MTSLRLTLTRPFVALFLIGCGGPPSPPSQPQPSPPPEVSAPAEASAPSASGPALPTPSDAGIRFRTTSARVPTEPSCFNKEQGGGFAKELINGMERVVAVHGGPSPISDDAWGTFEPPRPWVKNQDLHTRFTSHCVYRSPKVAADCTGDACATGRTVSDFTWNEVAALLAQDCLPRGSGQCSGLGASPKSFAVTVLRKCQTFVMEGELFVASDGRGNRYVVHATESPTPRLDPSLPDGWTMERIQADEPLEVSPFGEGDDCFHVVGHDNLAQLYSQFAFAGDVFPEGPAADEWTTLTGAAITEALVDHTVAWPGQGNQTWSAEGTTTTPIGQGHWKVDGERYCSQFPQQQWRCFTVARSPSGAKLRVTGDGQIAWVGTFVD